MSFSADQERVLKALADGLLNAGGSKPAAAPAPSGDELGDSFLDSQAWCDRTIKKDPKRWEGASMVGMTYSQAPAEWLESMAGLCEWKAAKGREENPPKCNDKGKPWHEVDAFEAKICRAFARRNRSSWYHGTLLHPRQESETPAQFDADEGLPF